MELKNKHEDFLLYLERYSNFNTSDYSNKKSTRI